MVGSNPNAIVLVVGSGAREHAIAWRISLSPLVLRVFVGPGNAGTAHRSSEGKLLSLGQDFDPNDFETLVAIVTKLKVTLVVPGADIQVVGGIRDACALNGIQCFAPFKATARLEGSKAFAKNFMQRHSIPTAQYASFVDYKLAMKYIRDANHRLVVKASGLAAGKGVFVTQTKEEALSALADLMLYKKFGAEAASEVIIEENLEGFELSILTFSDGKTFKSMATAQDHKRAYDGDLGPNTGGMGCVAPVPGISHELLQTIDESILEPTFDGIRKDGIMVTKDGPKVLEYNVRPGDPETQTLLPLLHDDCDLYKTMLACVNGNLAQIPLRMQEGSCVTVVMASEGYPMKFTDGRCITWKSNETDRQNLCIKDHSPSGSIVFHAATRATGQGSICSSGGRVLCVAGIGRDIDHAALVAYETVSRIYFDGCHYRTDIGHRYRKK